MKRQAWVVVDLGYGDQGKGTTVDFLTRDRGAHAVVRFNGGAQAGHNVVTSDGRHHTFSQFGAGTFIDGVETWLTEDFVVQPWAMVHEAQHLHALGVKDVFARTFIHPRAVVITPFHRAANRLRERARGEHRHGSCGVGVGEAVHDSRSLDERDVVRVEDLFDDRLVEKLTRVQARKRREFSAFRAMLISDESAREDFEDLDDLRTVDASVELLREFRSLAKHSVDARIERALERDGTVVFEGAQGILLDEWRGFHPFTTWSTCTPHAARRYCSGRDTEVKVLGVVRVYATRHGAGPMITEDQSLTEVLHERHNASHPWQGDFRVGVFDAVATRYAITVSEGVDALAVTCVDRLCPALSAMATKYLHDGETLSNLPVGEHGDLEFQSVVTEKITASRAVIEKISDGEMIEAIERECGVPVALTSHGPTARDKRWR